MRNIFHGDTQWAELEKEEALESTKIGRWKFFRMTSIINLREKNKKNENKKHSSRTGS